MSVPPADLDRVRRLLETDRIWAAYALADLEPPYAERSGWYLGERSVALLYSGLQPPLFFFLGDPGEIEATAGSLPAGPVQYGLLGTHRVRLGERLKVLREVKMWRMVLAEPPAVDAAQDVRRLGPDDARAILELFGDHPDRPDAFHEGQVSSGVFFGLEVGGSLVSVAGTHVIGRRARVAAIGNVFTHPDHRRRGHGAAVCTAVDRELISEGIETVVLNVGMDNEPALRLYTSLGFRPFRGYYEGSGILRGK